MTKAKTSGVHVHPAKRLSRPMQKGLNLVEVSPPNADPPVCKFLDVGKFPLRSAEESQSGAQDAEDAGHQGSEDASQHRHA